MKTKSRKIIFRRRIFLLLLVLIIFFLGRAITGKIYHKYKTIFPILSTYKKELNIKGYNILSEEVFSSDGDGICMFNAGEGEKVPVNYEIANLNLMNDTSNLKDELIKVNSAINYKNGNKDDNIDLTTNMTQSFTSLQDSLKFNSFEDAIKDINSISLNTTKSVNISELTDLMNNSIDELNKKKEDLLNIISKNNISYKSNFSGIVSFSIDSLEKFYTPELIEKIDYKYLNDHSNITNHQSQTEVKKGDKLFKLINNLEYYIALKFDNIKEVQDLNQNDFINLKFNSTNFLGEIIKINKSKDNGVLILKVKDKFNDVYKNRINDFKLILKEERSFEIPKSSIIKRNNLFGVYSEEIHGFVKFVPIKVLENQDNKSYISVGDKNSNIEINDKIYRTITINDSIVLNPNSIDEAKILN